MNRRNVLLGLGTAAAGSGIVFGSGAFTQVQASRDISIGVSTDGNALVELHPNPEIESVFQSDSGDNEGELAVDTNQLSSDDKGFNVGSTVQIGATTDPFGDEVDISDPAFEIINRFDDSSSSDDSNFDGTIDVGIDLSSINPSDEEQINGLEFIASQSGSDDGDASSSKVIKAGDRKVFTGLEPASSDGDDDRVAVAIRVETSNADGTFSIEDAITIQAGSDLTAGDFPNERAAPANTVENQDTEETYSSIQDAVDKANTDDTLFVGPGTYAESVTIDVEGLTLEGAGADATTITDGVLLNGADDVTLRGLEIEGSTLSGDDRTIGIINNVDGLAVEDNTILTQDVEGADGIVNNYGSNFTNAVIKNNVFEAPAEGESSNVRRLIYVNPGSDDGSSSVDIINNTFTGDGLAGGSGVGTQADDSEISGNTFDVGTEYGQLEIFAEDVDVENNDFKGDGLTDNVFYVSSEEIDLDAILNDQGNTFDPDGEVDENQIVLKDQQEPT